MNENLYPEAQQPMRVQEENKLQKGTIPYYLGTSLEIVFAIPLVVYKKIFQKPANKLIGVGDSVLGMTDRIPIVGGLCKRTRSGAAKIIKGQFSKYLDRNETHD